VICVVITPSLHALGYQKSFPFDPLAFITQTGLDYSREYYITAQSFGPNEVAGYRTT
jgi:hypothetical protein